MTETYETIISNGYFSFQKKYCKVTIEANDLDAFVKIVEHCKSLKEFQDVER